MCFIATSILRSAILRSVLLCGALCLVGQAPVGAQPAGAKTQEREGGFPDASFDMTFRKYTASTNTFAPYYSWDAHMAMNLTVIRKGSSAVTASGVMQTIGTENVGKRVSIGGTGYLLGFGYVHTHSHDLKWSVGFSHLSSHLTRDLDDKLAEEVSRGATIPTVADPSEYNVVFVRAYRRFPQLRFTPEIDVAVEPVNFRLNGGQRRDVRPVYLASRSTVWHGTQKGIVVETRHEIGRRPVNQAVLLLELYARDQPDGRFQIFVSASPGRGLHVSPNVGALRDGIALGVRVRFRA